MDDNDILSTLAVDADDYATTAAEDQEVTEDRTHLSEEAFAQTKANYVAKHDNGDIYKSLPASLPPAAGEDEPKAVLKGKHVILISAAVGELYFYRRFEEVLKVTSWLRERYDIEGSRGGKGGETLDDMLARWDKRCRECMAEDVNKS